MHTDTYLQVAWHSLAASSDHAHLPLITRVILPVHVSVVMP